MAWLRSKSLSIFLWKLLGTSDFWFLFLASFTCVLMMSWRSSVRDGVFKMAQKTMGKGRHY